MSAIEALRAKLTPGPKRDHNVVTDSSVSAGLHAAASKMQSYRSAEQQYTDHRQATGYQLYGPVPFGTFEVGRGSMPRNKKPTHVFLDQKARGVIYPHPDSTAPLQNGDPGAYDPHALTDLATKASFSHNRMKHAFGSHAAKALELDLFGLGVPGPGTYSIEAAAKKTFPEEDGNRSVFLSGTPQRLTAENLTPSPDTYRPQMTSVYGNLRNGGASMRSAAPRLLVMEHPDHVMVGGVGSADHVGPGTYEEHLHNSVAQIAKHNLGRSSKIRPGFGTTSGQRKLPFNQKSESPGPGAYQPEVWSGPYSKRKENSKARAARIAKSKATPIATDAAKAEVGKEPAPAAAPVEVS